MEISPKDLKTKIENKSLGDSFLVMIYKDNTFVANQYVNEIARIKNLNRQYIDDLEQVRNQTHVFDTPKNVLYVMHVDKFESSIDNFYSFKNVIVICNKMDKETKEAVFSTGAYSEIPELKDWQVLQYMKFKAGGIREDRLQWLYNLTKGDIYRIHNELSKIEVFNKEEQADIFNQIIDEGAFSDLSSLTLFNLTRALLRKDKVTVARVLSEIDVIDIDFMALVSILHRDIRDIIKVKLDVNATAKALDMEQKKFDAIAHSYTNLTKTQLLPMFEFITSIDFKLKSGQLQMSNERIIDYIICGILSIN